MLRSVVHKAIQARDSWEKVQERFVQDLRSDPANALGWSNKVFTAAAQYTIAQEARNDPVGAMIGVTGTGGRKGQEPSVGAGHSPEERENRGRSMVSRVRGYTGEQGVRL